MEQEYRPAVTLLLYRQAEQTLRRFDRPLLNFSVVACNEWGAAG
jgi:hypothetical protein